MSLFDELVNAAIREKPETSTLRPVVEKEILHHEILSILSREDLLKNLTFMGGTCLRDCYGSPRLSEDLGFSSDRDFSYDDFKSLGALLIERIRDKFGFSVEVSEPRRDEGDTRTWKIRVITRPESPHLPTQKIHIDICSLPSIERKPSLLINNYNIDMGTHGLVLQVESLEEILADKFTAFALRPNLVKNRDIWDIIWLKQRGVRPVSYTHLTLPTIYSV